MLVKSRYNLESISFHFHFLAVRSSSTDQIRMQNGLIFVSNASCAVHSVLGAAQHRMARPCEIRNDSIFYPESYVACENSRPHRAVPRNFSSNCFSLFRPILLIL